MEQYFQCECGYEFKDGDTIFFKPVPYVAEVMENDVDVEISPVCKKCIVEFSISYGGSHG